MWHSSNKRANVISLEREIRHGDTTSPKLFTAILEYIFKQLDWDHKNINIDDEYINHLWYTDDIILISDNLEDARQRLKELKQTVKKVGLTINIQTTKFITYLIICSYIKINGKEMEQVYEYKYLEHEIRIYRDNEIHMWNPSENSCKMDGIQQTIKVLQGRLPKFLKRKIYERCVLPIKTYGDETLMLTKESANKLQLKHRKSNNRN